METKYKLVRPATLVEGNEYLLNKRQAAAAEMSLAPVRFVAYCSSPAVVIVSNGNGKVRCARDDEFLLCLEKQARYSTCFSFKNVGLLTSCRNI